MILIIIIQISIKKINKEKYLSNQNIKRDSKKNF